MFMGLGILFIMFMGLNPPLPLPSSPLGSSPVVQEGVDSQGGHHRRRPAVGSHQEGARRRALPGHLKQVAPQGPRPAVDSQAVRRDSRGGRQADTLGQRVDKGLLPADRLRRRKACQGERHNPPAVPRAARRPGPVGAAWAADSPGPGVARSRRLGEARTQGR